MNKMLRYLAKMALINFKISYCHAFILNEKSCDQLSLRDNTFDTKLTEIDINPTPNRLL